MNKEIYFKKREALKLEMPKSFEPTEVEKEKAKEVRKQLADLLAEYKWFCSPCHKGDQVRMILGCGRTVVGEVLELGILHDGNIHPTSYKVGNKVKYISKPVKNIEVL